MTSRGGRDENFSAGGLWSGRRLRYGVAGASVVRPSRAHRSMWIRHPGGYTPSTVAVTRNGRQREECVDERPAPRRYRGRRRVPTPPRNRYATVVTSA